MKKLRREKLIKNILKGLIIVKESKMLVKVIFLKKILDYCECMGEIY